MSRCPFKIDMGAVFNIQPDRHNTSDKKAFVPMHKEMVFDIDMDVYDDVRSCCSGAKVCNKCWAYPMVAMKVLTVLLDEDFDFQNILWVFSGRRGIHGWVCDEEARTMTNEMRTAMVAYCNLGTGNELAGKLSLQQPLHPRLRNIFIMLYPMFEQIIIEDHNLLAQETHREKFL